MEICNFPKTLKILSVMDIRRKKKYSGQSKARNFHSISFRVKGNAVFKCDNETVLAKEKSLLFIPEGVTYETRTGSEHLYVVHFKTDEPINLNMISSFMPQTPGVYDNLFKKMFEIWKAKQTGYYFAATSCFYTIFENIQKDLEQTNVYNKSDKMNKVMEYIHTNFTDPELSLSSLTKIFGTSETYFRKEFKKIYGTTPLKYINNLRTQHALELLKSGYYLVSQVSEKSGFTDAKYFSRVLKKETGISPTDILKGQISL